MEKISFNKGGQWALEKSHEANWVWREKDPQKAREARENIPHMAGEKREAALKDLSDMTESRASKQGGREFLMHRGTNVDGEKYSTEHRSSWTPKFNIANHQAYHHDEPGKVQSAWVHEDNLVSSMRHQDYGDDHQARKVADQEHEWIVAHKQPVEIHKVVNSLRPTGKLHINSK